MFELNKNFRNEGISIKHNPEFTMLEFYVAYKDYRYLMDFTEELFATIANKVLGTLKVPYGDHVIDLTPPWPRIPMLESLRQKGVPDAVMTDRDFALKWAWEQKLEVKKDSSHAKIIDEVFKEFVEQYLVQPTFITDYPVELSPLAKRKPENPELTERFELFIAAREIANAFSELNDRSISAGDSKSRSRRNSRAMTRRMRWMRTLSGRSSTACRRLLAKASVSTALSCS